MLCSDWLDICYCYAKSKYTLNIDVCDSYIRGQGLRLENQKLLKSEWYCWQLDHSWLLSHQQCFPFIFDEKPRVWFSRDGSQQLSPHATPTPEGGPSPTLCSLHPHHTMAANRRNPDKSTSHQSPPHPAARSPHNPRSAWFSVNVVFIFFIFIIIIILFVYFYITTVFHTPQTHSHSHHTGWLLGVLQYFSTNNKSKPLAKQPFFHSILEPTMNFYILL